MNQAVVTKISLMLRSIEKRKLSNWIHQNIEVLVGMISPNMYVLDQNYTALNHNRKLKRAAELNVRKAACCRIV